MNNEYKKVTLINYMIRGVAILLLVVSFFFLFLEGDTVYESLKWGINTSNYDRVDLDSEYWYDSHSFLSV